MTEAPDGHPAFLAATTEQQTDTSVVWASGRAATVAASCSKLLLQVGGSRCPGGPTTLQKAAYGKHVVKGVRTTREHKRVVYIRFEFSINFFTK